MPRLADPTFWQPYLPQLRREFAELTMDILIAGGDDGAAAIRAGSVVFDWDTFNEDALAWLDMYLGVGGAGLPLGGSYPWAWALNEATRRGVTREIDRWVRAGAPLPELERRLLPFFDRRRAHRVAVTEVTRIYASGNVMAWKASGVVGGKRWQTARDEMVCPICSKLHNKFVELDRGWEFSTAMLEGDAALKRALRAPLTVIVPPAHVNCLLPGTEVVMPGRVRYATKSLYNGRCIEIRTAGGRVLTVTENHPILTRRGWVAARFVGQSDYVIGSAAAERVASDVSPDNDHMPTAIEQVFRSLQKSPGVVSGRVPATTEYFHGDGRHMNGDIEIVLADGFLRSDNQPGNRQPFGEFPLIGRAPGAGQLTSDGRFAGTFVGHDTPSGGFVSAGDLPLPGVHIHALPLGALRPGLVADSYAMTTQVGTEGKPADAQLLSQGVHGFTGQIAGSPGCKLVNDYGLMAASAAMNTGRFQGAGEGLLADTILAGKFCDRFSSQIAEDEVIEVREDDFRGHVYNLQVDPYHLYFANGIITHNCRCWLQPVVLEALSDQERTAGQFNPQV